MRKVRRPVQAGAFYEADPVSLRDQIKNCFLSNLGPGKLPRVSEERMKKVVGVICPHAGYMYSGPVAAFSFFNLATDGKPDLVVIMGPNHMGLGSGLAIMNEGTWRTPLGDVEVDSSIANKIVETASIIDVDDLSHEQEHSIEVQLPFLQFLYGSDFRIIPICFLMQDLTSAKEVGKALAVSLKNENAVIIASSDMTHYEPQKSAERKDLQVLAKVEKLDEDGFYSAVETLGVTACGYGPISTLIAATKALGAEEARLLSYRTSGDIVGDYSSVVGYAAVSFTKQ